MQGIPHIIIYLFLFACRSISLADPSANPDQLSVGTTLDGTRCGDEMVCASSTCVPLTQPTPCLFGTNNMECSGPANGVKIIAYIFPE